MIYESFAKFIGSICCFSSYVSSIQGFPKPLTKEEELQWVDRLADGDEKAREVAVMVKSFKDVVCDMMGEINEITNKPEQLTKDATYSNYGRCFSSTNYWSEDFTSSPVSPFDLQTRAMLAKIPSTDTTENNAILCAQAYGTAKG